MDVARTRTAWYRRVQVRWIALAMLVPAAGIAWYVQTNAPAIAAVGVVIDTVRRGDLEMLVRGTGALVSEQTQLVTALTSARVERVLVQSGQHVRAGDVLLSLTNPDVEIRAMEADRALSQARADAIAQSAAQENLSLTQRAVLAGLATQLRLANLERDVADSLSARAFVSALDATSKRAQADEQAERWSLESRRLRVLEETGTAQARERTNDIERLRAIAEFQHERVRSMQLRARTAGVLQDLSVQPGQWITEGSPIGKLIDPARLKAVLRVPESMARNVRLGQPATIDTRNGIVSGVVARRDAAASSGTVSLDIQFAGALPGGSVADQSVEGAVVLDRVSGVLRVKRPAGPVINGSVSVFRLSRDNNEATRVVVRVGRTTNIDIEIISGLAAGDRVIVSDVSAFDRVSKIRLKEGEPND
jgi:multidrug resistance efflux pump